MWLVLACVVLTAVYNCGRQETATDKQILYVDTIYDTIRVAHPVAVESVTVRHEVVPIMRYRDSVRVEARDSIVVRDSVAIVPISQKIYRDSIYTAWVSGYKPSLDSIEVYQRTITIKERAKRWGIGAQMGYGLTPKGFQPYVGVGVSYNISF